MVVPYKLISRIYADSLIILDFNGRINYVFSALDFFTYVVLTRRHKRCNSNLFNDILMLINQLLVYSAVSSVTQADLSARICQVSRNLITIPIKFYVL